MTVHSLVPTTIEEAVAALQRNPLDLTTPRMERAITLFGTIPHSAPASLSQAA